MPHSIEVAANIVIWINIIVLILTILLFVYTNYISIDRPMEEQIAGKKLIDIVFLAVLMFFLTSWIGFVLTTLIGNWGWLIALSFTLLMLYSTAKYRNSK